MSSHSASVIYIFETFCPVCHKNRDVNMDESLVGKKDLDDIECICGRTIPIETLKYLFRKKGIIENKEKYYIT